MFDARFAPFPARLPPRQRPTPCGGRLRRRRWWGGIPHTKPIPHTEPSKAYPLWGEAPPQAVVGRYSSYQAYPSYRAVKGLPSSGGEAPLQAVVGRRSSYRPARTIVYQGRHKEHSDEVHPRSGGAYLGKDSLTLRPTRKSASGAGLGMRKDDREKAKKKGTGK